MKKLLISIILILVINIVFAQNIQFGDTEKVFADGPYIFWENNDVTIQYILDGSLVTDTHQNKEGQFTIQLPGFTNDFEITSYPYPIPKTRYSNVPRIFAISDIHGQYDRFLEILNSNGIIDSSNNWNWGGGHLVILGDVFDRGNKVTEALWLIHKLERQAANQNGKVHLLLGNHEIMILQNDLRYVHDKYKEISNLIEKDYAMMFAENSELGKWLRSKNTIEVINNFLFVHGGISLELQNLNIEIEELNRVVRNNIDITKEERKKDVILNTIFGNKGPFWYRGYFADSSEREQIKQFHFFNILEKFEVSKIIIGHTTQDFINPFFKDSIIPIDTGIKYGDKGEALLWKDGVFHRAKADGYVEQLIFP